ncbi:MAG: nodulation protein NfeD [Desulfobacterales bacterium]|uniref:Nodulation protein NfeD n=1 Tax=Candidatus Desulfaltia bathyphila TaxID=2841697 RepID=A0A8J6T8R9_9BACT|nr:nodulation protein NfeD [Candidatus Desulfaltia bathyphila]MBL7194794.1 nodulation protein NfeD [Desulfobacterales bacterium]MBL7207191.1 nodulation protein NfeD [Desulfobacterales bacterium]
MKYKFFIITLSALLLLSSANGFSGENEIYIIKASGAISPATADFLKKRIKKASDDNVSCVIIELNTPGGLAESMRDIVMAILASRVPVVVYVSPGGARAASAGVMITMAADIAAMAPGTNIGAAHPVGAGGQKIDKTMSEKMVNDMVAHAKSVANKQGRNAEWVEKAIRESVSVTETEALKQNIIDIVATDMDDLIRQINGREIKDKGVINLDNPRRTILEENIRTKILKIISDPNIAYILMMIGMAGIYFELSHPGAIFPGVIGAIAIVLAFFSFQTLPVNYAGILLIILAMIFFIMEMKITSYGLLSIAGVTSLFLGSLMLFENASPELRVSWQVFLPTIVIVSGFFVTLASLVFKAQVSKPKTGAKGLVGEIGVVKEDIMPEGKVFVHGELWNATSKNRISKGTKVRVIKVVNLVLDVEPVSIGRHDN